MRLLIFLALAFAGSGPIAAADTDQDELFRLLQKAQTPEKAREYESRIWMNWFKSGDATIDEWMQKAVRQRNNYDFAGAIETLNKVIARDPEYSEVWNQRATVYFHQGEYEKSLEDVARTLELEPRHFGSLAGRAVIRLQQGKPAIAYQNFLEAAKLHPFLPEREFFPTVIEQ